MFNNQNFERHTKELKERFLKRAYNHKLINEHIEKANQLNRTELLKEESQRKYSIRSDFLLILAKHNWRFRKKVKRTSEKTK